jgi:pilus assembly protein Flp/PilA
MKFPVEGRGTGRLLKRFARCESGATAIEYSLIAALVSIVMVAALTTIGRNLNTKFQGVANQLQ